MSRTKPNVRARLTSFTNEVVEKSISALDERLLSAPSAEISESLRQRVLADKLVVAFVAEFSRGKSELINAIFFADFGQRLLPSSAGRTTMCPTELLYDAGRPPSIRLLPIETRQKEATVSEYKNYADEWVTIPLDLSSAEPVKRPGRWLPEFLHRPPLGSGPRSPRNH